MDATATESAGTMPARWQCDACPFTTIWADARVGHEAGPSSGRGWLGRGETHRMHLPAAEDAIEAAWLYSMRCYPVRRELPAIASVARARRRAERAERETQARAAGRCYHCNHAAAGWTLTSDHDGPPMCEPCDDDSFTVGECGDCHQSPTYGPRCELWTAGA